MKPILAIVLLALSGCAVCRQHEVACGVGVAVLAGSIALAADRPHHDNQWVYRRGIGPQVRP
jgi:hypothetical protein